MPTQTNFVPHKNYGRKIQSYVLMTVIIAVAAGIYGYFQFSKLMEAKTALAQGQMLLQQLQESEKQIASDYGVIKENFNNTYKTTRETINGVLPATEAYTELTRELDAFMYAHNETMNPIFMNSLSFNAPLMPADKPYSVLPLNLSLTATRDNFEKFLQYVKSSGSLEDGTRLLEITSISMSFKETTNEASGLNAISLLDINLNLNAYFQKTTTAKVTQP